MKKIYLAPLEGVTDNIYRKTFFEYYGGVDKFFTPFLSPNANLKFTTREFDEIDPKKNRVDITVPQLLTNNAKHFLWAAGEIAALGYKEINFNLGCPSGTVVAKKKGSGLLFYPEMLDELLYEVFEKLPEVCAEKGADAPAISIKTRLGRYEPEEFYEILEIFKKYPISELTIHPRIQSDFYKEPVREEFFQYACEHCDIPLVFNGEIKSCEDISRTFSSYEKIDAVMIGRALITRPSLAVEYKRHEPLSSENLFAGNTSLNEKTSSDPADGFDYKKFSAFRNDLLAQYEERFSGEKPVLHRMKEFWAFWQYLYPNEVKNIKKIQKAKNLLDYRSALSSLLIG